LQVYQQNLKERGHQLKEMVNELKNYQSQVNAYKFEIERLDKQIGSVKELYFNTRQNQIIYEDMEGEQTGDQEMQQNYLAQQQFAQQQ
jgi:archaellum component FlaC